MNMIETKLTFRANHSERSGASKGIVLHHAAVNGSVEDIHRAHQNRGYAGIGYHFYVRKDGSVYRGRPESWLGAHTSGHNNMLGVCAEGNFENETMGAAQKNAIVALLGYLIAKYGQLEICRHRDLDATACPGKNYPFAEIVAGVTVPEVKEEPKKESGYTQEQFIRDVQAAIGAEVDGEAGPETLGKTVTVSRWFNRKHPVVVPIQKRLYALGYTEVGEADGVAGALFQKAVKAYQKDNGCVRDGVITKGNKTWKKLLGMVQWKT